MNILVDTHYLIWSFTNPELIDNEIQKLLVSGDNFLCYSQASLWELSIKYNLGKLVLNGMSPEEFLEEVELSYFECLKFENEDLISFHRLPIEHKDPFDRIMIWQAIRNNFVFLSTDSELKNYKKYGLKTIEDIL